MNARDRKPLFARLQNGLRESIAHTKGELSLRTVKPPDTAPEIDAKTLVEIRSQIAMSQQVFAQMLNVSAKTVQSWEQGVRSPSDASRRLLQVFCEEPELFCRIVGLPAVHLAGVETRTLPSGVRKIVIAKRSGSASSSPRRAAANK